MDDALITYFAILKKASYQLIDQVMQDTRLPGVDFKFSHIKAIATFLEDSGYTVKELADNGMIKLPNMSVMIGDLVRNGFAHKRRSTQDRRKVVVTLTPEGRQLRARFIASRQKAAMDLFAKLDTAKQEDLLRSLKSLCTILEEGII